MNKPISIAAIASLLLISCGGSSAGTIAYGNSELRYDSDTWEEFTTEGATGISVKGDESCWIDLSGDLTKPLESEALEYTESGNLGYYMDSNIEFQYATVKLVGGDTVYGRISVVDPDSCIEHFFTLSGWNEEL
jgi:hypothetical protein